MLALKCMHCGKEYPLKRMFEGCPNCKSENFAANLVVKFDLKQIKKVLSREVLKERSKLGLSKYLELLPIEKTTSLATLGEGQTPLIKCEKLGQLLGMSNLYVKDESRNPTGTFKDRKACVGTSVALQFGLRNIVAGGGNMGTAAAAYGAKYGLGVISFETLGESKAAILQTLAYGGKVILLKRYEDRYELIKKCVDECGCYPVSSYTPSPTGDPYSQEGTKTIAYEICEDLGWKVPDKVIVPTGQGFCLYGIWNGFLDFYEIGLIESFPSMIAAESSSGGSFTKTEKRDPKYIKTIEPKATVARHAVAPKGSYKGLKAIIDSDGCSVTVTDEEVVNAVRLLARSEGIFSSTTSATAIAALKKLLGEGRISRDELVVCVITGGGLKDIDIIDTVLEKVPEPIGSDWRALETLLDENYGFSF